MACRAAIAALAASLAGAAGCAAGERIVYSPDELRATIARRAPAVPPDERIVPYEISEAHAAQARELVTGATTDADKVRMLVAAMFDPDVFGLHYADGAVGTAEETLASRRGDCLALASVFVGLARAVGVPAQFLDASVRIHETLYLDDETSVHFGHVTAMVDTGVGKVGLDFAQLGTIVWWRVIDDPEALAHFYNNRGYALLQGARSEGAAVDWVGAARQFELAVAVKPGFARGWNNLGIAAAHLGRPDEASADYRRAIESDPALAAPRANLGALLLQEGRLDQALAALEAAARLDPEGAHIQYTLAVARLRKGDRDGAVRALRRALELNQGYPSARELLDQLTLGPAGSAAAGHGS